MRLPGRFLEEESYQNGFGADVGQMGILWNRVRPKLIKRGAFSGENFPDGVWVSTVGFKAMVRGVKPRARERRWQYDQRESGVYDRRLYASPGPIPLRGANKLSLRLCRGFQLNFRALAPVD